MATSPHSFKSLNEEKDYENELELTLDMEKLVNKMKSTSEYREIMSKHSEQLYAKTITEDNDVTILVKCLKESNNDVNKAVAIFDKLMQWRADNDIDNCLDNWNFDVEGIKKYYPHQFQGFDLQGRPIYIERLGKIDIKGLNKICSLDDFARYHVYHHEFLQRVLLPQASKLAGRQIRQFVTICDVGGIGVSHLGKPVMDLLGKVAEIDQSYYPASGARLYMVNAPWVFKAVWKLIAPFIAARGRDKISVIYGDPSAKLAGDCNVDKLPKFLGGKVEDDVYGEDEVLYRDMVQGKQLFREAVSAA